MGAIPDEPRPKPRTLGCSFLIDLIQKTVLEMESGMKTGLLFAMALLLVGISSSERGLGVFPEESMSKAHFPTVKASSLENRELTLPGDFDGARNLVLVAFEREQQKNVDSWLHKMSQFEELDTDFRYYELPTIERMNAFMRWFIDSGMRRGIPDRKARERTITLYLDKKLFCDALAISDQKRIYALLVDRQGNVLWRAEGDYDEDKAASLKSALEAHRR